MAPSSNKGHKTSSGSSSHRSGFIPTPSSSSFSGNTFHLSTASTNNNTSPSGTGTRTATVNDAPVSFQLSTYLARTATEDGPTYGRLLDQAQNPNTYYYGAPHPFDADLHNDSKK